MFESIILYFKANGLEYIGTIAGILGVWFSIKEKIITWPTFIICYTIYVFLAFKGRFTRKYVAKHCLYRSLCIWVVAVESS